MLTLASYFRPEEDQRASGQNVGKVPTFLKLVSENYLFLMTFSAFRLTLLILIILQLMNAQ